MTDRFADYENVQSRINKFWADHELGCIDCVFLERDDNHVIMKAFVWRVMGDPQPAATGTAQETHDGSPVNRQGWMIETAETSAIGRALANMGYATKTARPSSEDMERATARNRRQIADSNLAMVTMERLRSIKGTDLAAEIKDLAVEHGKYMVTLSDRTLKELAGDPEWRALVDEVLDRDE